MPLCRGFNVAGASWDLAAGQICSPWLHLDFFSRRWYADLPQLGAQTRFFGAGPPVREPEAVPPDLVLITLGSLFTDDPAFFRIAAEAVLAEGGQPLVVTGRRGQIAVPGLPAAIPAVDWVDFDAVLPGAAGIIHHGGVGTTHAALRHGVPQVIVPHAGDQHAQAGRITPAGRLRRSPGRLHPRQRPLVRPPIAGQRNAARRRACLADRAGGAGWPRCRGRCAARHDSHLRKVTVIWPCAQRIRFQLAPVRGIISRVSMHTAASASASTPSSCLAPTPIAAPASAATSASFWRTCPPQHPILT
ncbi:MAG: hypothetical protein R2844_16145 [Caldilineales bacterium]